MGLFFEDPMYERQATATLGYAFYGGSEPGECLATVRRIEEGDAESWHREFSASLRWSVVQRACWVHGIDSLADYVRVAKDYELSSVADQIRCPSLVTRAENDPVGNFAELLYDALQSPKEMLHFTDAEGAGDHCEQMARSLFHQKSFDWLDETLGTNAP